MKKRYLIIGLLTFVLIATAFSVDARTLMTYCKNSSDVKIPCNITFEGNTQVYDGITPVNFTSLNDDQQYEGTYMSLGYQTDNHSLYMDSAIDGTAAGNDQ